LALGIDLLVTGDWSLIQAHALTTSVPIVGVAADLVGVGLAANLARPGGNVTGLSLLSAEFSGGIERPGQPDLCATFHPPGHP